MEQFDLVIIGAGPAGEKAAAKASYFGKSVALVERNFAPGGAGVHTGTLPSKTLKETALFLSGKNDKGKFGVDRDLRRELNIEDFYFRKNSVTKSEVNAIQNNITRHRIKFFNGIAKFLTPNSVRIKNESGNEEDISGNYFLIATGSFPHHPPEITFDCKRVHDSDSILSLTRFPKSITVLGAGVIGCEYATIFSTMGIQVNLIDTKNQILPFLDGEISDSLVQIMRKDGVDVVFDCGVSSVSNPSNDDEDLEITLTNGRVIKSDMFLFAAGRSGRSKELSLQEIGVKVGKRDIIEVNDHYQTSVPNIYAVGDVVGFPALASTSMDQGRVAVTHMFATHGFGKIAGLFPYGIYTVPEVSMVGLSEEEAKKQGHDICTGKAYYKDMARGKILGCEEGFLKLVFETKQMSILGVHIIGINATEIIHYGLSLVENHKDLNYIISVAFNYPTLHDLYKYAAYDGLGNLSGHKVK